MCKALAALAIGAALATLTRGAQYEARAQGREKLKEELRQIDTAPKPGDEVVALRDSQLKAGAETVGAVRKGDKLVVEQVQGNWLWVQSGQTRGWIDGSRVISAALMHWYRRLPDGAPIHEGESVRMKCEGVFLVVDGGGGMSTINNRGHVKIGTLELPRGFLAIGQKVVFLLTQSETGRILSVTFMRRAEAQADFPPRDLPLYLNAARRYGTLRQGDFVRLAAGARQVFVNGQLRQAGRR
jgi:hypothetical protein